MPSIRYRAHGFVCSVQLFEVPDHETAYVKNKLKADGAPSWSPVRWCGFVCKSGSKVMSWARPGKLNASAVSNGNGFTGEWRDLKENEYVAAIIVQIDDATYGAFALVDSDYWPVVRSDDSPKLVVVSTAKPKVLPFAKKAG